MAMFPPIMHEPIGGFRSPLPNKGISYPGISPAAGGQPGGGQMIPIDASIGFRAPPIRTHGPGGLNGRPIHYPGINGLPGEPEQFGGQGGGQLDPMEQIRQFLANSRFHGQGIPYPGISPAGGLQEGAGGLGGHPLAGLIEALGSGHVSPIDLDGRRPNRAQAPAFRAQ